MRNFLSLFSEEKETGNSGTSSHVDISNSRDTTSLHNLFQGGLDGVEGETEAGVAAAEGEFPFTGAPNLSGLAIDGDWCSQQEEAAVVGGVGG